MTDNTTNAVNLETGTVEVEIFRQTDAALAALRDKYAELPSTETEGGYEFVKAGVKEITTYRTTLDAKRKEIKQPYLDAGRVIDSEAKRITAELVKIEEPLKAAKKEADEREKRKKEERIARLQKKVDTIAAHVQTAKGKSSAEIAAIIEQVDRIQIEDFYDLTEQATKVKNDTLDTLAEMFSAQANHEQAEAERAEALEAQRKAEAEAEAARQAGEIERRINNLRLIPMGLMGKPSADVRSKIAQLQNHPVVAAEFGSRADEATQAYQQVLQQLDMLAQQVEAMEAMQAQQQAQQPPAETGQVDAAPAVSHSSYEAMKDDLVPDTPADPLPPQQQTYDVTVEFSGYVRGTKTFRVTASSEQEALELYRETGECVETAITRDDTEINHDSASLS